MTSYRLVLDPRRPYLVDEAGQSTSVVDALRSGKVHVEHEVNFRFLDGHYGPLHYLRLGRRPIGGHFCAPLARRDAEAMAEAAGVSIRRCHTPIANTDAPRSGDQICVAQPLKISVSHFARLPIYEDVPDLNRQIVGYWARKGTAASSIMICQGPTWVEMPVQFT